MTDAAAHLLDPNLTTFGQLQLGCLFRTARAVPDKCTRHQTVSFDFARDLYWMLDTSIPRSRATCSTVVSWLSPSIAARTMLCGLVEPRLLVRMSEMPAHSMMARTAPPAMTPAPGAAGFISTLPAPCWPMISCGIVLPVSGTCVSLRRAASTALRTASETSFALPDANPTRP